MEEQIPNPSPDNTASINDDINWLQAINDTTLPFFINTFEYLTGFSELCECCMEVITNVHDKIMR